MSHCKWCFGEWKYRLSSKTARISIARTRATESLFQRRLSRGFNLSKPPHASGTFQMDEDIYQFIWTHHHILMDGWCGPLVIKEFFPFTKRSAKVKIYNWNQSVPTETT